MSSVSPFKAEPPKFLAPIEEKPAVEEKTEPEPTKEIAGLRECWMTQRNSITLTCSVFSVGMHRIASTITKLS